MTTQAFSNAFVIFWIDSPSAIFSHSCWVKTSDKICHVANIILRKKKNYANEMNQRRENTNEHEAELHFIGRRKIRMLRVMHEYCQIKLE